MKTVANCFVGWIAGRKPWPSAFTALTENRAWPLLPNRLNKSAGVMAVNLFADIEGDEK